MHRFGEGTQTEATARPAGYGQEALAQTGQEIASMPIDDVEMQAEQVEALDRSARKACRLHDVGRHHRQLAGPHQMLLIADAHQQRQIDGDVEHPIGYGALPHLPPAVHAPPPPAQWADPGSG